MGRPSAYDLSESQVIEPTSRQKLVDELARHIVDGAFQLPSMQKKYLLRVMSSASLKAQRHIREIDPKLYRACGRK